MKNGNSIAGGLAFSLAALFVTISGCIPRPPGGGGAPGGDPGATSSTEAAASSPQGKACSADGVIDDGEDANNQIAVQKGRGGYWYSFVDKAGSTVTPVAGEAGGTFAMTPGGANGSVNAARMNGKLGASGTIFAGIGFNFADPKAPFDVSGYKGISFWAKRGEASTGTIRVKLPDANTDPEGKVCTECFNDFGMDIELTTTWARYVVLFASATQGVGWGAPRPPTFEPSKAFGIQWQVNTPGVDYEIWVDDIQFTGCP